MANDDGMTDEDKAEILANERAEAEADNRTTAEVVADMTKPADPTPASVAVLSPTQAGGSLALAAPLRENALPFEAANADHVWRLSQQLSKSTLVPQTLRGNPANVFMIIMTGRELDLKPMQSIATLNVIDGKIGMSAQLMVAKCLQSGACEYFRCIETTRESATYETKRKGAPDSVRLTFTIQEAKEYGLVDKRGSNYVSKPAVMLRWRASSQLARDVFPDVTLGMYTEDELQEIAAGAPASVRAAVGSGMAGLRDVVSPGDGAA